MPIPEVALTGYTGFISMTFSALLILIGVYLILKSQFDQLENDPYGFDHIRYFNREGNDFPVPFKMKSLSRTALLCRHPMVLGALLFMVGTLIHGSLSYGRLLFSFCYILASFMGTYFEEQELLTKDIDSYKVYCEVIPNILLPDLNILTAKETEL